MAGNNDSGTSPPTLNDRGFLICCSVFIDCVAGRSGRWREINDVGGSRDPAEVRSAIGQICDECQAKKVESEAWKASDAMASYLKPEWPA